jgi:hypothetical protein
MAKSGYVQDERYAAVPWMAKSGNCLEKTGRADERLKACHGISVVGSSHW